MALFTGNYSNDMRYVTFKYPFDINVTSGQIYEHIYKDIPTRIFHFHNFMTISDQTCFLNMKLITVNHESENFYSHKILIFPSDKNDLESCLNEGERLTATTRIMSKTELEKRLNLIKILITVWLALSLVMSINQVYNAD